MELKMEILLVFMYIFGFKIYSIVDSTVLVGLLLFTFLLLNKKYFSAERVSLKKYHCNLSPGRLH